MTLEDKAREIVGKLEWSSKIPYIEGLILTGLREAIAAEREACAKKMDDLAKLAEMMRDTNAWRALKSAADGIRATT